MDITPEFYKSINNFQLNAGNDLIGIILRDNPEKLFDVIVDIGCGSGDLTQILSNKIRHKRIIALDMKPEMIRFANENHRTDTIEYIVQDISKPWDELSSTLRELEGKVSLLFSNYVIHWIENKEVVVKNFAKLLARNSYLFINTATLPDINDNLDEQQRRENEKLIQIPSSEEQIKVWQNLFADNGITILSTNISQVDMPLNKQQAIGLLQCEFNLYDSFYVSKDPKERAIVREKISNAIFETLTNKSKGNINPNAIEEFIKDETPVGRSLRCPNIQFIGRRM